MTNDMTPREPEPIQDDGFTGPLNNTTRTVRGTLLRWKDSSHWTDRDGLTPPSPLLVIAVKELLQKWKDGEAETITDLPLPDAEELNSTIPQSEWEIGIDGTPSKPWKHTIAVYFVSPATGALYTYLAATIGAHIAYDALKEAVMTMRALRGARVMPLVLLAERPMKTKWGSKLRPHFDIIAWKTAGNEEPRAVPSSAPAQLNAPTAPAASAEPASAEPAKAPAPQAPQTPQTRPKKAPAKATAKMAVETLATMGNVQPVTLQEEIDDGIPW